MQNIQNNFCLKSHVNRDTINSKVPTALCHVVAKGVVLRQREREEKQRDAGVGSGEGGEWVKGM